MLLPPCFEVWASVDRPRGNASRGAVSDQRNNSGLDEPVQDLFRVSTMGIRMVWRFPNGRLMVRQKFLDMTLNKVAERWKDSHIRH
ncbi:MAG: hypothetical protein UBAL2_80620206 [Leptospirillum rubarum]|jgi:hypothetical protein|nr:MAG: hypothetical protein UBAL2_80620206 [Leptospirillum rubarum]